jgi:hypothetical protein
VPDNPNPPTPREWVEIAVWAALTALAYATIPVFWGG